MFVGYENYLKASEGAISDGFMKTRWRLFPAFSCPNTLFLAFFLYFGAKSVSLFSFCYSDLYCFLLRFLRSKWQRRWNQALSQYLSQRAKFDMKFIFLRLPDGWEFNCHVDRLNVKSQMCSSFLTLALHYLSDNYRKCPAQNQPLEALLSRWPWRGRALLDAVEWHSNFKSVARAQSLLGQELLGSVNVRWLLVLEGLQFPRQMTKPDFL